MRGFPSKLDTFFRGIPFEPPRAVTSAKTLGDLLQDIQSLLPSQPGQQRRFGILGGGRREGPPKIL